MPKYLPKNRIHYVERLPEIYGNSAQMPRLGRNINHDPRNLFYQHAAGRTLRQPQDVRWQRFVPAFDQGQVGSCTGNAMEGVLATAPFAVPGQGPVWDELGALHLYTEATALDPYPGQYPAQDTGSDGTSVAQAAKNDGLISGYRTAVGLEAALDALLDGPVITGVKWYTSGFNPDPDGRVRFTGTVAGGHEFEVFSVDVEQRRVWCWQSWGRSWGVNGTFYMTWDDWDAQLKDQGDVTVPIPVTQPAPTPAPPLPDPTDADENLWYGHVGTVRKYAGHEKHYYPEARIMAALLREWAQAKGFDL